MSAVIDLLRKAGIEVDGPCPSDPRVHDRRLFNRVLAEGSLGLGEAYLDGWWDCEDLSQFFYLVCRARLDEQVIPRSFWLQILRARLCNLQAPSRSFHIGEVHYDLGNDLYRAMLDPRMVYTCGYWKGAKSLAEAQEAKLELVCKKIGLKRGMRVLDIGCGWGAFLKYAAENYGVSGVGVTVSKGQAARFEIYPVSSKWELEGKAETSGLELLRTRLERLAYDEKKGVEQTAAEQKFGKLLEAEFGILRARRKFLLESEEGRIQKARDLRKIVIDTEEAERDVSLSFQAEFRDVIEKFNTFIGNLEVDALEKVADPVGKLLPGPGMSSSAYVKKSYAIIREHLIVVLRETEPRLWKFLEEKYADLLSRYRGRIENLLEGMATSASKALELELPARELDERVTFTSMRASFNPNLHETTLSGLFLFIISCLPLKASSRFLRDHLGQVVKDAVATNFESVRWELVKVLEKDFRATAASFAQGLEQIRQTLESVIQTSAEQNRGALQCGQEEISVIADRNLALQALYGPVGQRPLEVLSRRN
jgi:hypothetical protein